MLFMCLFAFASGISFISISCGINENSTNRNKATVFSVVSSVSSLSAVVFQPLELDEAFTDTRIEDVDVEFDDSEEEPTVEQASGNSFEEIDKAVETATKPNVTNEECVHAGKVFSEMEGNELFNMIAERSKIIKRRIDALMELHMSNISSDKPMSGKATKVIKKKKLVVPEDFKDFNIRDFV